MSVNSSSSSNSSLPPAPPSPSVNTSSPMYSCLSSKLGTITVTAFTIISVLVLLPLYVFVLYVGLRRRRRQRCSATISHSDLFTYHMVLIELISVLGSIVLCCGVHTDLPQMMMAGVYPLNINIFGQTLFHILTCVERYLAVVHPVTYLSLRKAKWIRIRNITVGYVWLQSFAATSLMSVVDYVSYDILCVCIIAFVLPVVSFCSLAVLCVLIRPGPGEEGGGRQRVDQSKLRAFYTIMAILGVLLIRFGGGVLIGALHLSQQLGGNECVGPLSLPWFFLPSSLVLPLLFLQRAGKLLCCKRNKASGTDQIRMENNQ